MADLKKAFHAARVYREHSQKQAAEELGVSETFLIMFLKGEGTSAPLDSKVRDYIYNAGIVKSIKKLGLNPSSPVKKVEPTTA